MTDVDEVADLDKPSVYTDAGKTVYRASALGHCTKALIAARMGYEAMPPPEAVKLRFDEGHLHEPDILRRMVDEDWDLPSKQVTIELPVTSRIIVRGHTDAIGYRDGRRFVVEAKSQSKEEYEKFDRNGWESGYFPLYKWQLSAYMLAEDSPAVVVRKNRDSGVMSYEYVHEPFYSLTEIKVRVLIIEAAAMAAQLPGPCDRRDWGCGYWLLHEDEPVTQLEDETLDSVARQYEQARVEASSALARKDELRKVLRAGLVGIDKATTKLGTKITFYTAKNPPRINEEKMKADGVDVEKYKEQGESERLRVTLPKEDDARG